MGEGTLNDCKLFAFEELLNDSILKYKLDVVFESEFHHIQRIKIDLPELYKNFIRLYPATEATIKFKAMLYDYMRKLDKEFEENTFPHFSH